MAAGIATLQELTADGYAKLEEAAAELAAGLRQAAAAAGSPASVARFGPLLTVFFRPTIPTDSAEAFESDRAAYARFFGSMLDQGFLLPPSQFEAWFPSMAHGPDEIEGTVAAARTAFEEPAA
jgi:glutamate-1-semialdehyde 2,1-aminomutase